MPVPLPKAFWPLTIVTGVNDRIDFTLDTVNEYRVAVAPGTYYSAASLAAAVYAAMTSADGGWTGGTAPYGGSSYGGPGTRLLVWVDAAGRFTIAARTYALTLQFGTGPNAAASIAAALGFDAADTGGGIVVTAPHQHPNGWYAEDPPEDDTGDLPLFERAQAVALTGRVKGLQHAVRYRREIRLAFLKEHKLLRDAEGSTYLNESVQRLFEAGWSRFRWWPDASVEAVYADYALDLETAKALPRVRLSPGSPLYSLKLGLLRRV